MEPIYIERNGEKFELAAEEIEEIYERKEIELCRQDIISGFEDLTIEQDEYFSKYKIMENEEEIMRMARLMREYTRNFESSWVDARDCAYMDACDACKKAEMFYNGLFSKDEPAPVDIYNPGQRLYISSNAVDKILIFNVDPDDNERIKEILCAAPDEKERLMKTGDRAVNADPESLFEFITINSKGWGTSQTKINNINRAPKTKEELKALCRDESVYLGDIDTSLIEDMSGLFFDSDRKDFSGIEKWDTRNAANMSFMFCGAKWFDAPIGNWVTDKVEDMSWMFHWASSFKQDIKEWKLKPDVKQTGMFEGCPIAERHKPSALKQRDNASHLNHEMVR